ncbi:DUF167 domain-containing protein [bacterium]|nr:DUF167 domain-containing protein [bacterium]
MLSKFKKELSAKNEIYLAIKARPNAAKTYFKSVMADNTIKVYIKAVPERGKANKKLIELLSKTFNVPEKNIKIISGTADRLKLIKILK